MATTASASSASAFGKDPHSRPRSGSSTTMHSNFWKSLITWQSPNSMPPRKDSKDEPMSPQSSPQMRWSRRFRSSEESSHNSGMSGHEQHDLVEEGSDGAPHKSPRPLSTGSRGFREMSVDSAASGNSDTNKSGKRRLLLERILSNRFSGRFVRARHPSTASSVPYGSTHEDEVVETPPAFERPKPPPIRVVRYYSLEEEPQSPSTPLSEDNGSEQSSRFVRGASEHSLSYFFATASPPSSPLPPLPPASAEEQTSSNNAEELDTTLRSRRKSARLVRTLSNRASSRSLNSSSSSSPPMAIEITDEVHRQLLLKVQFISLVNDMRKVFCEESRARKAERICKMFLTEGSMFYVLETALEERFKQLFAFGDAEQVLLELKEAFLDELARHEAIEMILRECSKW